MTERPVVVSLPPSAPGPGCCRCGVPYQDQGFSRTGGVELNHWVPRCACWRAGYEPNPLEPWRGRVVLSGEELTVYEPDGVTVAWRGPVRSSTTATTAPWWHTIHFGNPFPGRVYSERGPERRVKADWPCPFARRVAIQDRRKGWVPPDPLEPVRDAIAEFLGWYPDWVAGHRERAHVEYDAIIAAVVAYGKRGAGT